MGASSYPAWIGSHFAPETLRRGRSRQRMAGITLHGRRRTWCRSTHLGCRSHPIRNRQSLGHESAVGLLDRAGLTVRAKVGHNRACPGDATYADVAGTALCDLEGVDIHPCVSVIRGTVRSTGAAERARPMESWMGRVDLRHSLTRFTPPLRCRIGRSSRNTAQRRSRRWRREDEQHPVKLSGWELGIANVSDGFDRAGARSRAASCAPQRDSG